jgi:hypothetical protein
MPRDLLIEEKIFAHFRCNVLEHGVLESKWNPIR